MENATRIKIGLFVAFVLVLLLVIFVASPKNCGEDTECFNQRAPKCLRTAVSATNQGNLFLYEMRGKKGPELCILKVQLVRANPEAKENLKKALEGKGMLCEIPRSLLAETPVSKIENINDYCTGPLKEVFLEISLENLYEAVVKQLGTLAVQFRQSLEALNTTS